MRRTRFTGLDIGLRSRDGTDQHFHVFYDIIEEIDVDAARVCIVQVCCLQAE
jgi:hypothetical protein